MSTFIFCCSERARLFRVSFNRGDIIDESGAIPTIAGRRINMFDVMAALSSPDAESQLYEDWNLSEEEAEAAIMYVRQNRETLQEMLETQTGYDKYK